MKNFFEVGKKFPPEEENDRFEMYEKNRLLYENEHDSVFWGSRTTILQGSSYQREFNLNLFKIASRVFADLLFGEEPKIKLPENHPATDFLSSFVLQTHFQEKMYSVAIDVHRYGTGIAKVYMENGNVYVEAIPPTGWIPVFNDGRPKQVAEHILFSEVNGVLTTEEHLPGAVRVQHFSVRNGIIEELLDSEEKATGVNDFLVVDFQNSLVSDRYIGYDEYRDIETIVDGLETRFIQRAKILDSHSNPAMQGPDYLIKRDPITGKAYVDVGGGKYFPRSGDDPEVKYITWDGKLEAVQKEIDDLERMFYIISGVSPALLGIIKPGLAESGSALKRLLIHTLAKVNSYKKIFDVKMKQVISIASELAVANGVEGAKKIDITDVVIDWQDGIPNDYTQQVQDESLAVSAGLTSKRSAMKRLYGLDGKALDAEEKQIHQEEQIERIITTAEAPSLKESMGYIEKKIGNG